MLIIITEIKNERKKNNNYGLPTAAQVKLILMASITSLIGNPGSLTQFG